MTKNLELSLKHLKDLEYGKIPEEVNKYVEKVSAPHIESFNFCVGEGLLAAVRHIHPVEFTLKNGEQIHVRIDDVQIGKPQLPPETEVVDLNLYPKECIERRSTYGAPVLLSISWKVNGMKMPYLHQYVGDIPVMVKSSKCHLAHRSPAELAKCGEAVNLIGGYFIVNGSEKLLRLLIANRRNYPVVLCRENWKQRDYTFTEKGVMMRCVREDETACMNTLHYLNTGHCKLGFVLGREHFFVSLAMILKALVDKTDKQIYNDLIQGRESDTYYAEKIKHMLRDIQAKQMYTQTVCQEYIGKSFRHKLYQLFDSQHSNVYIFNYLAESCILIHLNTNIEKYHCLCMMARKLYAFVGGECLPESVDSVSLQEAILGGHIYLQFLKEKLEDFLMSIKIQTFVKCKNEGSNFKMTPAVMQRFVKNAKKFGNIFQTFVATGSLATRTGCGLMQKDGLTVVVDHLNRMRDLSHFRAIHRGSFFAESKSTAPRRLSGEAWGDETWVAYCSLESKKQSMEWQHSASRKVKFRQTTSAQKIMFTTFWDRKGVLLVNVLPRGSYDLFGVSLLGFICPVHTPDGAPCGLLNHLTSDCIILNERPSDDVEFELLETIHSLGLIPMSSLPLVPYSKCYEVCLDGNLIGHIPKCDSANFVNKLRLMKAAAKIFKYTEIVLIKSNPLGGQYNGIFLFTGPCRLMRPVLNLLAGCKEYIGSFEQMYLNIATSMDDYDKEIHTHIELDKLKIFSNVGKLVPFSDCNPNPRNMYQCQMGKQSMGTPLHNWQTQTHSKLYRLQYPQVPLIRNAHYDALNMEEFALGFNAVVAIISYTGYDMEDAMVVNKASMERGFAHGFLYKSELIDLTKSQNSKYSQREISKIFKRDPENSALSKFLDTFGLPHPGTQLKHDDPFYCSYDVQQHMYSVTRYKGEPCVVDKYTIMASTYSPGEIQKACITFRIKRNPIIGDKFASRSGQKGILSRLYPMEDMPFSDRGIVPDIIFNPHGIPSRMTAGKLIELLAGKTAAEFGKSFDSSPFEFTDENNHVDYYGQMLEQAGFNYYGEDILYSGTDGRKIQVEVFQGIVYYQRLRHMTSDKWQVRSTGPVDYITRQPIKGRKKGGAIRFGEMERDCLISHGAALTLKDRLMDCSDMTKAMVCSTCGNMFSSMSVCVSGIKTYSVQHPECHVCGPEGNILEVNVPHAFKYLVAELACLGIKIKFDLSSAHDLFRKMIDL